MMAARFAIAAVGEFAFRFLHDLRMNQRIALFSLTNFLSHAASAQVATTRSECTRRCIAMDPANPRKAAFEEKLKSVREKKSRETDADKTRDLEKQKTRLIDKH